MEEDVAAKIKEKKKENWLEVWFAIEALGLDKDIVENALRNHIDKLNGTPNVFIYEKTFRDIELVKNPMKDIDQAWSFLCEVRLFVKDLYTLLNVIYLYGPSAIEILGPNSKEIKIQELQDMANTLAGLVHQFAAAGVGGIIMTPDRKNVCN